jgi:hypothetical protein
VSSKELIPRCFCNPNEYQIITITMERTIRIGADEIILWLRKNHRAENIPNDGIDGLGRRIYDVVERLGGSKVDDSVRSYWDETDSRVQQTGLPKTSAQYDISVNQLPALYLEIMNW